MVAGAGALRPELHGALTPSSRPATAGGAGEPGRFREALERQSQPIQLSRHAARRIEQRGLRLDEDRMARLANAVARAEQKGARDSLVLLDELALVVSVQNHTVITAMDEGSRSEHVFTNIDSVVIAS